MWRSIQLCWGNPEWVIKHIVNHNRYDLLLMNMQNSIVSRFAEDRKVLLPLYRMPLDSVNILSIIKKGCRKLKIKWLGQSCFLITTENGTKILTDPFKNMLGYKLPEIEANIVSTSHNHSDHNNINAVKGSFTHFDKPGTFASNGIAIKGVATFHDKALGSKRGKNIVYTFSIDGIKICHCGDLGHILIDTQINEIGTVDILLLPVGGRATINALDAVQVMKQLNPAIVIPMHYRTKAFGLLGFIFEKVDKFIAASGLKTKYFKELDIDETKMKENKDDKEIVILQYN